ncbi:WD40 repeat domain-containing protein [Catellatospora citrea]|uniref:WD40 repeat domain-containing protein n=1 Tax=Catellatospora citrea TaxID=53366 RepID=UPI003406EDD8
MLPHPGTAWVLRTFRGPDGGVRLLSGGSEAVRAWDPSSGEQVTVFDTDWPGTHDFVVCHPDGRDPVLAVATEDGVWWHDAITGEAIGGDESITDMIWGMAAARMPDGTQTLFGAGYSHPFVIHRWDATSRQALPDLGSHDDHIVAASVIELPDRDPIVLATGWSHTIHRWDPTTGLEVGPPLERHKGIVHWMKAITLAAGRTLLVSGDSAGEVRRWDLLTGEPVGSPIQAHPGDATVLPLWAGGRAQLLTSGDDDVVRRWDALTGELLGEPAAGFDPVLLTISGEQTIATAGPGGVRITRLSLT